MGVKNLDSQFAPVAVDIHKHVFAAKTHRARPQLESTRTIKLIQFVNQSELDPVYIDAAYYVGPDGPVAQDAFRIVHKAMRKTKKVGIGQITMHSSDRRSSLQLRRKFRPGVRIHLGLSRT